MVVKKGGSNKSPKSPPPSHRRACIIYHRYVLSLWEEDSSLLRTKVLVPRRPLKYYYPEVSLYSVSCVRAMADLGFLMTFPHKQYVSWCSERLSSTRRLWVSVSVCFSASDKKCRVSLSSLEWISERILLIT